MSELIARIQYVCPKKNTSWIVGPEDYEFRVDHLRLGGVRVSIICATVNCLCGQKHEISFGEPS